MYLMLSWCERSVLYNIYSIPKDYIHIIITDFVDSVFGGSMF